nr:CopD family protein [uncultured Roseateles sp.]
MNIVITAFLCLHLLAAALWVGGMATIQLCVRPAALQTLESPPLRLGLMAATLQRFFALVLGAIVVLLLSGLAMWGLSPGAMHWSVHAMAGLGLLMMGLFGHIRWALFPRLQKACAAQTWAVAAAALNKIRQLVAVNLGLGCGVFVIAIVGRAI